MGLKKISMAREGFDEGTVLAVIRPSVGTRFNKRLGMGQKTVWMVRGENFPDDLPSWQRGDDGWAWGAWQWKS